MTTGRHSVHYVRPGYFLSHIANPIVARLRLFPTLTVVGRTSGLRRTNPIGEPFSFQGRRYLVSGRGQTQWARNLRAAGRCELHSHGRTERLRAVEIGGDERIRIVHAYRSWLGHAGDRYFSEIPNLADHPVFRLEPETPVPS